MRTPKINRKCACGCGEKPKSGRFLPGHDAKLRSTLVRRARGSNVSAKRGALQRLREFGWKLGVRSHQVA